MRQDRNDTITVEWNNIYPTYQSQFVDTYDTVNLGVPYDLGSVMQYSSIVRFALCQSVRLVN